MSNVNIVRYSDEELAEFKKLIDSKLDQARQEYEYMREQIVELNENASEKQGGNWFDDSSIHTELEMLNSMVIRQQQFINNLENALIRIQNKTYGVCVVTGQLIEKQRLLLVPHATKSVAAKEIETEERKKQDAISKASENQLKPIATEIAPEKKIITKVVKKSTKNDSKSAPVKSDDLDDLELDLDIDEEDDSDYDSDMMTNMDMDEIADDQDYYDK